MRRRITLLLIPIVLISVLFVSCGGGSSPSLALVLEPAPNAEGVSEPMLEQARDIIDKRLDRLDIDGSASIAAGRIEVRAAGMDATKQAFLLRAGLLMFCEPVLNDAGDIAITRDGDVSYQPGTCEPERDDAGDIVVEGGEIEYGAWDPNIQTFAKADIVWQPARSERGTTALTSQLMRPTTYIAEDQLGNPGLVVEFDDEGADLAGEITERLVSKTYPLAIFLDGLPVRGEDGTIIAPSVNAKITSVAAINGLSKEDAEQLSALLNSGTLPFALSVYEQLY